MFHLDTLIDSAQRRAVNGLFSAATAARRARNVRILLLLAAVLFAALAAGALLVATLLAVRTDPALIGAPDFDTALAARSRLHQTRGAAGPGQRTTA